MNKTIIDAQIQIFNAINELKENFPKKEFTMDGRLVGDIGEIVAEEDYKIDLYDKIVKDYDAETEVNKRKVQIKATYKENLTIKKTPELYLGLKLYEDGRHEEIYNGPGKYIEEYFGHRKGYGKILIPLSIKKMREISKMIPESERIERRIVKHSENNMNKEIKKSYIQNILIEKLGKGQCVISTLKKTKTFTAQVINDGIKVSNLGNSGLLPWNVFDESYSLLQNKKNLLKGDAMNFRLGEKGLPVDSLEGHIAKVVYNKKDGDIIFRRITPVVNILIYAGICTNKKRYIELNNNR